ncbi:MAG: MFS transporter [Chloroflexi bacterium]|nr:MFS transporter [Chloroflexota bacterium]
MSRYLIFAAIAMSLMLSSISGTAVAVAFPVITSSFGVSLVMAGWVLGIYQLAATAAMPLGGTASEILGNKPVFMVSLLLFVLGSLFSALAPSIYLLILARLVQGIGAGAFFPAATAIVADEFPRSRPQVIGFFTSIFQVGQIIGPNLGGWMTQTFGWRSVFWFNVPLGVAALLVSAFLLQPGRKEGGQIDLVGVGLFTGSLLAFMVSISMMGNSTASSWVLSGLLLLLAAGLMLYFIRYEGRTKNPLFDLPLLREKTFMSANIYNFILGAATIGVLSFVPLYAVSVYGMSTVASGLILTPRSVSIMVASAITSVFLVRWGYRRPLLVGTVAVGISLVLLGVTIPDFRVGGLQVNSTLLLVFIMLLSGFGMGTLAPAANNVCIDLMPNRVATITGVRGMFRQSGSAIGIAVASLVLHSFSNMAYGFAVVFLALAAIMFLSLIWVFALPRRAGEVC